MTISQTSVSQLEKFDRHHPGGCERRWYLEDVQGLKPDMGTGAKAGDAGHQLLAMHFKGEAIPKRASMRKSVMGAIQKGDIPKPGPDLFVEVRFDGQEKFAKNAAGETLCECGLPERSHVSTSGSPVTAGDCKEFRAKWNPLDHSKTIWIGGVPLDGFIDLTFRRSPIPVVLDHKFSADINERAAMLADEPGQPGAKLIKGSQMPVYAHAMRREWPDATGFWLYHHYIARTGTESFFRRAFVTVEQIEERIAEIAKVIQKMRLYSDAKTQDEVPFNRRSCHHWLGCAMQSTCRAFKENQMDQLSPLSAAEEALLFGGDAKAAPASNDDPFAAPASSPAAEEDEETKLQRQLDEAKAKKAAKKAADEAAAAKAKADAEAKTKADAAKKLSPVPDCTNPACRHCAAPLTPENGSKLRDGSWVHVGCASAPASEPSADVKPEGAKRGPKPKGDVVEHVITLKADPELMAVLKAIAAK